MSDKPKPTKEKQEPKPVVNPPQNEIFKGNKQTPLDPNKITAKIKFK